MCKRNILILIFGVMAASCGHHETVVSFANVCQEKNETFVQIRGFLNATPDLTPNQSLLVEHKNGTGGFIKILANEAAATKNNEEVKIIGKVLKDDNGCVLKAEKIETP